MKVWIEKPVTEKPEKDGTYNLFYNDKFITTVTYKDGNWIAWPRTPTTHYLVELDISDIVKKAASDAWDEACLYNFPQNHKTEYLKTLNHEIRNNLRW